MVNGAGGLFVIGREWFNEARASSI